MTTLEKLKAGWKPMCDGQPVGQLTYFEGATNGYPFVGVFNGSFRSWSVNGKHYIYGNPSDKDLIFLPPTVTIWLNVYKDGAGKTILYNHSTKDEAENRKATNLTPIAIAQPFTFTLNQEE